MSIATCKGCHSLINTDDDPESTDFRENEFWCEGCREYWQIREEYEKEGAHS